MSALVTADLHLNDLARDADRWNLLPWLAKQVKKTGAKQVLLLGDITDLKDRHPATLVNRLVDAFCDLSNYAEVLIIPGNHDYIDEKLPFFSFLRQTARSIHFFQTPTEWNVDGGVSLLLPSTRNWEQTYGDQDFRPYKYIFTHQTFDGALAENGTGLSGISPKVFDNTKAQIWSGDIHTPQRINWHINYVGAPYHVHFGDTFKPRVVLLKNGGSENLHFPGRGRELIVGRNLKHVEETRFDMGTQVKIRIQLKRSEYHEWPALKQQIRALAERRGWEVCGLELKTLDVVEKGDKTETPRILDATEIVEAYAERKKLGKLLRNAGLTFIEEAEK